jgi:hypothetical protein
VETIDKSIHKFGIVTSGFSDSILGLLNSCGNKKGFEINADSNNNGHKIKITNQEISESYNFMHVHEYKKEGSVLGAEESEEIGFVPVPPPEKVEFVLADFSLLITNEFILFCSMSGTHSRNKSKANYLLNVLISIVDKTYSCHLIHICREEVLRKITTNGVKEIVVGSFLSSDDYAKILSNEQAGFMSSFKDFFATTETGINKKNQDGNTSGIKLSAKATSSTMNKDELIAAAIRYVSQEEPDDYTIILKNKKGSITPTEMRTSYNRQFYPFENSVAWEVVKSKMIEIFQNNES